MPVKIRVKNFQSIQDATVEIAGFVAITGPNNSGKTALMRAIKALATNASSGPYLRHGEAWLEVEMVFSDGTSVLWEKGHERPGAKGKSINRYTVNGKMIQAVGRGAPPEVASLGISEITAGSSKIWPQVAEQFNPLFLLDRSGSVVAEALSDVEKVGKLSEALRLAEKDKRSWASELKIRKRDLSSAKERLEFFEGLDVVSTLVSDAVLSLSTVERLGLELRELNELSVRLSGVLGVWEELASFEFSSPDSTRASRIKKVLGKVSHFRVSWKALEDQVLLYGNFWWASPNSQEASTTLAELVVAQRYQQRLADLQNVSETLLQWSPFDFPSPPSGESLSEALQLQGSCRKLQEDIETYSASLEDTKKLLAEQERDVEVLLGDLGLCPTCKTVHVSEEV